MRGKVWGIVAPEKAQGITPAYAGKRKIPQTVVSKCRDHPRLCGEKFALFSAGMCLIRITPAYAGKSRIPITQFLNIQDHPRLCGEKFRIPRIADSKLGSPPPMRGKAPLLQRGEVGRRITPAYAGKRCTYLSNAGARQDHPRLCGEKSLLLQNSKLYSGSPPPMRGKEKATFSATNSLRITPAYAGKS